MVSFQLQSPSLSSSCQARLLLCCVLLAQKPLMKQEKWKIRVWGCDELTCLFPPPCSSLACNFHSEVIHSYTLHQNLGAVVCFREVTHQDPSVASERGRWDHVSPWFLRACSCSKRSRLSPASQLPVAFGSTEPEQVSMSAKRLFQPSLSPKCG